MWKILTLIHDTDSLTFRLKMKIFIIIFTEKSTALILEKMS